MTKDDQRSFRATFLDCKNAQQKLLEWIDDLIEENRPLDPDDRHPFLRILANATLGEDSQLKIPKLTKNNYLKGFDWQVDGVGDKVEPESVGDFVRYLVYETDENPNWGSDKNHSISELWKTARSLILRVYPHALRTAVRSSQEILRKEETRIHSYGTKRKKEDKQISEGTDQSK